MSERFVVSEPDVPRVHPPDGERGDVRGLPSRAPPHARPWNIHRTRPGTQTQCLKT